jgi:hypothetical protein
MLDLVALDAAEECNVTDRAGVALPFFRALSFLKFTFCACQAMRPSPGLCMQYNALQTLRLS